MENWNKRQITPGMTSFSLEAIAINLTGRAFDAAMDSTDEINRVVEITPKEGFDLKLELIAEAEDIRSHCRWQRLIVAEKQNREVSHVGLTSMKCGVFPRFF